MSALAFANPAGLYDPTPHGYSHLATIPAGARLLLPAGQSGMAADGSMPADFRGQLRQAIANLGLALAAGGGTLAEVVRTTLLVVDHDLAKLAIVAEELARAWPDKKPASTLIPVPCLALPDMLVEIDAIAVARS